MYQGFFKEGMSLMAAFFFIVVVVSWLRFVPIVFLLPIIWFYSFFNSMNRNNLPEEEFNKLEDDFLWPDLFKNFNIPQSAFFKKGLAIVLMLIGFEMLLQNISEFLGSIFGWNYVYYIRNAISFLPQLVIAFAIIAIGFRLIIGKKKEIESREEDVDGEN